MRLPVHLVGPCWTHPGRRPVAAQLSRSGNQVPRVSQHPGGHTFRRQGPAGERKIEMDLTARYGMLQLIEANGASVIFHPASFTLLRTDSKTASLLAELSRERRLADTHREGALCESTSEALLEAIDRAVEQRSSQAAPGWTFLPSPLPGGFLERLVVNVSNACNLRCRYCYANGGSYGGDRAQMDSDLALEAVEAIYDHFPMIGGIQFFGGEPFLNLPVIERVCRHVRKLYDEKKIVWMPRFGAVTNGTILTDQARDLLAEFNFGVTVSLDGPAPIHNYLRPGNFGNSFEQTADTVFALGKAGVGEIAVQATFTRYHWELGMTVKDLLDFFHNECNVAVCHIVPVGCDETSVLALEDESRLRREFRDAARQSIRSLCTGQPKGLVAAFGVLMDLLTRRNPELFCDAGLSALTVAVDGSVYPCFMLVGRPEYRMGMARRGESPLDKRWQVAVSQSGIETFYEAWPCSLTAEPAVHTSFSTVPGSRYHEVAARLKANLKQNNDSCHQCWAKALCEGCIGASLLEANNIARPARALCQTSLGMAEGVLLEVSELQQDRVLWDAVARTILQNMSLSTLPCS